MNTSEHSGFNGSKLSFASAALRGAGRARAGIVAAMLPILLCRCGEAPLSENVGSAEAAAIGTSTTTTTISSSGGRAGLATHLTTPVTVTPHGTSIDVEFEFSDAIDVFVEVGTGPLPSGYLNYSGSNAGLYATSKYSATATHHLVQLTGLRPGTQYYVNVVGWKANVPAKTLYRMVQVSLDSIYDRLSDPGVQFEAVGRVGGTWTINMNDPTKAGCYWGNAMPADDGCCNVMLEPPHVEPFTRYCEGTCVSTCTMVHYERPSFGILTHGVSFSSGLDAWELYPGNIYAASRFVTHNGLTSSVLVVASDSVPLDVIGSVGSGVVSTSGHGYCIDPSNYVDNTMHACAPTTQSTVNLDLRPKNGQEAFSQMVPVHLVKGAASGWSGFTVDMNFTYTVTYSSSVPWGALSLTPDGVQVVTNRSCQKTIVPGDHDPLFSNSAATAALFICPNTDLEGNPVSGP